MRASRSSLPDVETPTRPDVEQQTEILPPWLVILHDDDHNEMMYVVQCLQKTVPHLSHNRAIEIMLEAHNQGQAVVTSCPLELAELYRDRLEGFGLTATIEKA